MNYLKAGDGYVESWPECDPDVVQVLANAAFHAHLWEKYYYPDMVSRGENDPMGILSLALNWVAWDMRASGKSLSAGRQQRLKWGNYANDEG